MTVRKLIWGCVKWFLFRVDAETAHHFTLVLIRLAHRFGEWPLRLVSGAHRRIQVPVLRAPAPAKVFGMEFANRVGLAAGLDKNADIVTALPALGFGFAEIGTVTPRPQPGNDRPRLFRDPTRRALFNRMGFNSLGAAIVSDRLRKARPLLPPRFRIGINIGKNKETPNDLASQDYVAAAKAFEGLVDYVVINVSSPNTPGLRELQDSAFLKPIVQGVHGVLTEWKTRPPLLLKLAPELTEEHLRALMPTVESWGWIDGWVLTNTLAGTRKCASGQELPGGWSGSPLTDRSRASLVAARALTRLPIVSVGGILTPEEAKLRLNGGADLIQLYTGWIYEGPSFPTEVARSALLP